MDLNEYRESAQEVDRVADLMRFAVNGGAIALDVGARDGFLAVKLTEYFDKVVALDLDTPTIDHGKIENCQGDVTALQFSDNYFDFVLCAEVLEHIPTDSLLAACRELARVTKRRLLIGVPYDQDTRLGRTTCSHCGAKNPPWAHVNSFDIERLEKLFCDMKMIGTSFVGSTKAKTNFISTFLMDLAGNPYGTYEQEEPCIVCSYPVGNPSDRNFFQKICTRFALYILQGQKHFLKEQPNWIHVLLEK